MKRKALVFFLFAVVLVSFCMAPVCLAEDIRLIVRGDDLGMTQGSIAAFEKSFKEGVLTCASLLVVAPWFEAATDLIRRNPGWCIGVHLCLVGEWQGYRWRPVLPWSKVPSLVDADGFLFPAPDELWSHKPRPEEIEAEFRAQIDLVLKKGVKLQYLDLHYAANDDVKKIIRKLSKEYALPISGTLGEKYAISVYKTPVDGKLASALKQIDQLTPGLWLWVAHPGIESPEQNALVHTSPEDRFTGGGVGRHRAAETGVLTSREVKDAIAKKKIRLTTYRELR
ncbi:MAG: ChbG/HpnK family deacetylase [Syntrophaceae bacterium]